MGAELNQQTWTVTREVVTRHVFGEPTARLEALSTKECLAYLQRGGIGRVAFAVGGVALVLPVDFQMLGDQEIVFLTESGSKLRAVESGCIMTFQIDHFEADTASGPGGAQRSGWSVLATGPARATSAPELVRQVNQLGVRPTTVSDQLHVVTIDVRFVTGRRFGGLDDQAHPLHRREP